MLTDLELRAAAGNAGIWAHTDWDSLPVERQLERDEERELQVALGNGELPAGFTVELNSAPRSELMRLPGIGETLANRIIEKRPYARLTDLLEVRPPTASSSRSCGWMRERSDGRSEGTRSERLRLLPLNFLVGGIMDAGLVRRR